MRLTYTKDPSIEVIVIGEKKVLFEDKEQSLTAVTRKLLGLNHDVQPTGYWNFEGKNLRENL